VLPTGSYIADEKFGKQSLSQNQLQFCVLSAYWKSIEMRLAALIAPLLAAAALGQKTSAYTDAKTGIAFQSFADSTTGYRFGIALPTTPTGDLIGQLVVKGSGWAGVSLGGTMLSHLLVAAWPNGQNVLASFRTTECVFFLVLPDSQQLKRSLVQFLR
jgi:hypothetical protein